jgi:uncharacterized protein (UPF0333 family)
MLKKFQIIGVLAAVIAIAPGAAFAGQQIQNTQQSTVQTGAAVGDSNTVVNNATQTTIQNARKLKKGANCVSSSQVQSSVQNIGQSGAAVGTGNTVVNTGDQNALQTATRLASSYGRCR